MGYYTNYEFGTKDNKAYKVKDIVSYMKDQYDKSNGDKFYPFSYEFEDYLNDEITCDFELYSSDATKWYYHDEEMIELSKQFPETVFYLYGEGEESGDLWYQYYKNGKSQYCPAIVTYEPYDESKLR